MNAQLDNGSLGRRVVVIGGGATGTGIAREAAERGFEVTLIERGELGAGTTGRFHGILHSGARYAVNDTEVAAECYQENQLLRRVIPSAITDTGGIFLAIGDDEVRHADLIIEACLKAGIPIEEISKQEATRLEPNITTKVSRAFLVPDAFIDGRELLRLNREAGLQSDTPVEFMEGYTVKGLEVSGGKVLSVTLENSSTGSSQVIECDFVVNAAGVWAGEVAGLANVPFEMVFDKGTMILFKENLSNMVLNRCRPEADGDLLVPSGDGSIMGTTSRVVGGPDDHAPTQEEVDSLIRDGAEMVPQLTEAEPIRVFAGVRPLVSDGKVSSTGETRSISRSFQVIDHSSQGVDNLISVVGGKVTLYRRMAKEAVDSLERKLG